VLICSLSDHAWGKDGTDSNHRLPDKCQYCLRLFLTKKSLEEHIQNNRLQDRVCQKLSALELEEKNWEPNRHGISIERKEAIDKIRDEISKGKVPRHYDNNTMAMLKQRVESNVSLYVNGSDTSEGTAKSELWKWYLIFKQLRPDDEVPMNPCRFHLTVFKLSGANISSSHVKTATSRSRRQI